MSLRLDWCSHKAARYAVEHWHYSRSMPTPPHRLIGVWESDRFIGVVIFSRGATNNLGCPYRLSNTEVCELTRVALDGHVVPVSRVVAIALRMLKQSNPGLRLCVSFADKNEGHTGTIYQAGNWLYAGQTDAAPKFRDKRGRVWHSRQCSRTGVKRQYGALRTVPRFSDCERIVQLPKHRYLYALDDEMRKQIEPLRQPYPRAASIDSDAAGFHPAEGGATPTAALHLSPEPERA